MKLTLAEPRLLKESISIISELVSETKIHLNKDYLEVTAMDPANVAMILFKMPKSVFAEYEVEDTTISINLNNFKQILRRVKNTDVLTLEIKENKLHITMKDKSTRTFQLPLLDLEDKKQKEPELEFKTVVSMNSSDFNEAIEDVDIVAESVVLATEENAFKVSASGDLTNAEVSINQDEDTVIDSQGDHKSKYSIEYLKKMMQGSKIASTVNVKFSTDYPLKLEYTEKERLSLSFILAPRVDND